MTACVAMLSGLFLEIEEKSIPDRKMSHTTLWMGSNAVCEPKYLPSCWLKSASESMASTMLVIASTFVGAKSLRISRGEVNDSSSLNPSTVAAVPCSIWDRIAGSPSASADSRSEILSWLRNSMQLLRPSLNLRRWACVFKRRASECLSAY